MEYVTPQYSRATVDAAGIRLIAPDLSLDDREDALAVINNWRSAHSFPLNSFHVTLRDRARKVDSHAVTAQRLKRLSSIEAKLRRFDDMKLSQMQDIGGCRAVVKRLALVHRIVKVYKQSAAKNPNKRGKLLKEYDYIQNPKRDGYRGVHLIFKYRSDSKRHSAYNNLRVEIQLRSQLQHAWATAVETVGTFTQQALKSSQGEADWLRFFALMGSAIAMRERAPLVPDTPSDRQELRQELLRYAQQLDVISHMELYAAAVQAPERAGAKQAQYFLLELDPVLKRIRVTGYRSNELDKASSDYLTVERNILSGAAGRDAVLVSVKSFSALKQAYPNYFLDTHRFIRAVRQATADEPHGMRRTGDTAQGELFLSAETANL
ncbi:MAG TPA: RelA/SpoT domain-containing protein [Candidatus Nanoarchaeia archaeon]|nr:RelA/SpoT domain-containing protein [Candidatus Nanoarchaeia archaeon]